MQSLARLITATASALRPRVERLEHRTLLADVVFGVTGFALVNADTDQVVFELHSGMTVDLAAVGTNRLNVVARTTGGPGSVRFGYNGNARFGLDATNDFSAAGDDGAGDFSAWVFAEGVHTFSAVPFADAAGTGVRGEPMAIFFRVTGVPPTAPPPIPIPAEGADPDNTGPAVSLGATTLGTFGGSGPHQFLLRADASDIDGVVERVEFFANGAYVGTADAAPWMIAWRDVTVPGAYDIVARAVDDDGAAVLSSAGTITVLAPDPSGATIVVEPGQNLNEAIRTARPGDTVLVKPGVYKGRIELRRSGTPERPITIAADGPPGSVIVDANGAARSLAPEDLGDGKWTTIRGITFRNADNEPLQSRAAVVTADGMRLIDVTVEGVTGAGIGVMGRDVVLLRVTARDNGCTGIGGSDAANSMVLDSESSGNNTLEFSGSFEGGGGKFTRADGLLVDHYHSHDNIGPGIWIDIDSINVVIRDGVFHDNRNVLSEHAAEGVHIHGRAIMLEISGVDSDGKGGVRAAGPVLVERNLTYDNAGASVHVYATASATIQGNLFVNDPIELKDGRPAPWRVRDLTIVDNRLKDAGIWADGETVKNYRDEDFVIDRNTYDTPRNLFRWGSRDIPTLELARSVLGFETSGRTQFITFTRP